MRNRYIIDRFEGNYAILEKENEFMLRVPVDKILGNPKEGYILTKEGECFKIDMEATETRKQQVDDKVKDMWN